MHLGFAFDSSKQLRLGLKPVFYLMAGLRTLIFINGVGPAGHRVRRWRRVRFAVI